MKPTIEDAPTEKIYWGISEVAKECKVAISKLRFYEEAFDLRSTRGPRGSRRYTYEQRLRMVLVVKLGRAFKGKYVKKLIKAGMEGEALMLLNNLKKQLKARKKAPEIKVVHLDEGGPSFEMEGNGDLKMMQDGMV